MNEPTKRINDPATIAMIAKSNQEAKDGKLVDLGSFAEYVAPVEIPAKALLQELLESHLSWHAISVYQTAPQVLAKQDRFLAAKAAIMNALERSQLNPKTQPLEGGGMSPILVSCPYCHAPSLIATSLTTGCCEYQRVKYLRGRWAKGCPKCESYRVRIDTFTAGRERMARHTCMECMFTEGSRGG